MTAEAHQEPTRSTPASPLIRARRFRDCALIGLGAICVFVLNIRMVNEVAGAGHDASWRQAYGYFFIFLIVTIPAC